MFDHLTGAFHFWHYQAPPSRCHQPRRLEEHIEEIEVIVKGRGYFQVEGGIVDAGPGSSLWYLPGDVVVVTSHEADPYETIVFRFEVSGHPPERPPPYSEWTDSAECGRFCRRALELFMRKQAQTAETAFCHYGRLLWEYQEHRRRGGEEAFPIQLRKALNLIELRFAEQIEVAEIADAAGMSASHLHLLFRRHLGSSPTQRLIDRRLHSAQGLLGAGTMTVKEVCFASGFRDFSYFCALFKRRTGTTPSNYASTSPIST